MPYDKIDQILKTEPRENWCALIIKVHPKIRFSTLVAKRGFLRACLRGRGLIQDEINELVEQFGERRK